MTKDEFYSILGSIFAFTIVYIIPTTMCLIQAVQTKNSVLAKMAFIPVVNIVGMIISAGDIVFRYFT